MFDVNDAHEILFLGFMGNMLPKLFFQTPSLSRGAGWGGGGDESAMDSLHGKKHVFSCLHKVAQWGPKILSLPRELQILVALT